MKDTWDEAMVRAGVKFKEGAEVNAHTNRITLSPLEAAALKRAEEKGVKLKAGVEIQVASAQSESPKSRNREQSRGGRTDYLNLDVPVRALTDDARVKRIRAVNQHSKDLYRGGYDAA